MTPEMSFQSTPSIVVRALAAFRARGVHVGYCQLPAAWSQSIYVAYMLVSFTLQLVALILTFNLKI